MLFRVDFNVPAWLKRLYRDLPFSMSLVRWWLFWDGLQTFSLTVIKVNIELAASRIIFHVTPVKRSLNL